MWRDGDNVVAPHFHTSPFSPSDDLELTVVRRVIPDDVKRAIGFEPLPHGRDLKGEMAMRRVRLWAGEVA